VSRVTDLLTTTH